MIPFTELPLDIVLIIAGYLDAASFIALTQTCQDLANPAFAHSWFFWSSAVRCTFRVPNQPVVAHDGLRWKKLYRRLLTETRPYTWGSNAHGNLGHSYKDRYELARLPPRAVLRARQRSWPMEMEDYTQYGVIADLQAGGWSTTFLTSQGALFSAGIMDGTSLHHPLVRSQQTRPKPEMLEFPRGYVHPTIRYDRETAIQQFSAGRAHVLGLSDAGRIWSWNDMTELGLSVKFLNIDLNERGNLNARSKVKKVVAGWNKSAALIEEVGIVLWEPVVRTTDEAEAEDAMLVLEFAVVPRTGFQRGNITQQSTKVTGGESDESIGEVLGFIVLENYVVFNTHHGRIFASKIDLDHNDEESSDLLETQNHPHSPGSLIELHPEQVQEVKTSRNPEDDGGNFVTDVQGTFRNFAVFTRSGQVLTGTQDLIIQLESPDSRVDQPTFTKIPALQNTGVIALAFGDYHFLALHEDGFITSYGTECQGCGSLGLGGHRDPEGRLRGIRYNGMSGDGKLVSHAYTTGRRVWFEPEKRKWIQFLLSGGRDPEEAVDRMRMTQETMVQAEVSEWIEQEGNAWGTRFAHPVDHDDTTAQPPPQDDGDDNLSPYFALSVAAAGWHSGALVLVNDASASRIAQNCIDPVPLPAPPAAAEPSFLSRLTSNIYWFLGLPPAVAQGGGDPHRPIPTRQGADPGYRASADPVNHGAAPDRNSRYRWAGDAFPRLELSDGRVMPGTVEVSEWRDGRPEWVPFEAYS